MEDYSVFLGMFESSPDAILLFRFVKEGDWILEYANEATSTLFGVMPQEAVGRSMADFFSTQIDCDSYSDLVSRLDRKGSFSGESWRRLADGSVFRIEFNVTGMIDGGERYALVRERDISERYNAETKVRESEALFRMMIDASPDSVMLVRTEGDATWKIVQFNAMTAKMHGYSPEEMGELTVTDLNAKPWTPEGGETWLDMLRAEGTRTGETTHRRKNGEVFTIEYRVSILYIGGKEYYLAIDRDITDRKRYEEELLQGTKLRAVGEMAGGIAHEFNNLLTPMMLQLGTLRDAYRDNAVLLEQLRPFETAVTSAKDLTQRILTFGRKGKVVVERLDLVSVIADVIAFLSRMIDRRISVEFDENSPPRWVDANRGDIHQILMNLAINARDALVEKLSATDDQSWKPLMKFTCGIEMSVPSGHNNPALSGKRAWYAVSLVDTGCGMDEGTVKRAFEPFFTTKKSEVGAGLGLSTVWSLTARMGGWVKIESVVREGTTVKVYLPLARDPDSVSPPGEMMATPGVEGDKREKGHARILIVDDNDLIAMLLSKIVTRRSHEAKVVMDGTEALCEIGNGGNGFDLVITDINMPGATGIDILRKIRDGRMGCKVIVMGGDITRETRETLNALGIDGILAKPFTYEQVAAALGKLGW